MKFLLMFIRRLQRIKPVCYNMEIKQRLIKLSKCV
jgi:hypothetical protein